MYDLDWNFYVVDVCPNGLIHAGRSSVRHLYLQGIHSIAVHRVCGVLVSTEDAKKKDFHTYKK